MVAHERMKRAETEDELKEAQQEKEALRSALKLLEGENGRLRIIEEDVDRRRIEGRRAIDLRPSEGDEEEEGEREGARRRSAIEIRDLDAIPHGAGPSRSRSSSEVGTKSPVAVPVSVPLEQGEEVHQPLHSEPQPHSNPTEEAPEDTADSGSTDTAGAQPGEAMSFFLSPPEPNFKPSTPGSHLTEEPSPWA